jgi:hypothetical protein
VPGYNASGDIFSFNGDARFEGPVAGRGGAGGQLSVSLEVDVCHGIGAEASARATGGANGTLSILFAAVQGTGFLSAAAGLAARAQLKPDAFDRFGLIAEVAAYAEASAGFRLGGGLDGNGIGVWARDNLSGAPLEIFFAFLRELIVGGGVWGRASAAAMAQAHADVSVSLAEGDKSGFVIEAGAALGWGAGTGWDFYVAASFTDIRRFYQTAARIITREVVAQARAALPGELNYAGDVLQLALPVALNTAFDLGQKAALGTLGPPEDLAAPFLVASGNSLRDYVLDRIRDAAEGALFDLFELVSVALGEGTLSTDREAEFQSAVDDLVDYLRAGGDAEIKFADLPALTSKVVAVVAAVLPDSEDDVRTSLAVLWTVLAALDRLHDFTPTLSGSASLVGLGTGNLASDVGDLAEPPAFVRNVYRDVLGHAVTVITLPDAVEFLLAVSAESLLARSGGAAPFVLDEWGAMLGVSTAELVEAALQLALGTDIESLALYQRLRDYLQARLDGEVRGNLLPALRTAMGAQSSEYIDTVAAPSLAALSSFVFTSLDAVVAGIDAADHSPFVAKLSAGCSAVVVGIAARNALFFDRIVVDFLLDHMPNMLEDAAQLIRDDPDHIATRTMRVLLPNTFPFVQLVTEDDIAALQTFLAKLADIGALATGPDVWTPERRSRFAELKRVALLGSGNAEDKFRDANTALQFVSDLVVCGHVENAQALVDLAGFLAEVVAVEAAIIVPRGATALMEFFLAIGQAPLRKLEHLAGDFLSWLADNIEKARKQVDRWMRELTLATTALSNALRAQGDAFEALAAELRKTNRHQRIKDALYALGARRAERAVRMLDNSLSSKFPGEDQAVAVALGVYGLAFAVASPLIDLALNAAAAIADDLADILDGVANAIDAAEAIVVAIVNAAIDALEAGVLGLHVSLPKEISADDVAEAIADALPADLLLGLLDDYYTATQNIAGARADKATASSNLRSAQAHVVQRKLAYRLARRKGRLSIDIESPLPLPERFDRIFALGPDVALQVAVGGVTQAFFARGRQRRVRVAVNGRELPFDEGEWKIAGTNRYRFSRTLTPGSRVLVSGVNVLEVSVVDGEGAIRRQAISFIVNTKVHALTGVLSVDARASHFISTPAASLRSHAAVDEQVVLRWESGDALPLDKWRVVDLGGRFEYTFHRHRIAADGMIALVSRGSPSGDTDAVVHAGLRQDVWNDAGGIVGVIDADGILRAFLRYR